MRGINDLLTHPVLLLFLFGVYFPYFTMLEDLIVRYKLSILILTYSTLFLTYDQTMLSIHQVNMPAVRLVSIWSITVAIMVTAYRLY